ncbi:MAG: 2,3-bisphosphoglycerate-independent phosphoglycerate mutase [Actinobacteria bacterium HGW-Actinobacteria-7]|nr:MAG: 2,3-bisphosphoglycerate-independent phosphoglycerate mutase [Actinobacteria bacterium HGW-Actinobacteria-7]
MTRNLPAALIIMDGFGVRAERDGNAVAAACTPNLDELFSAWPHTTLDAAGLAVGLPEGQMGNSEVGHLNIGAGRVVYQELTRIDLAVADGSLETNPVLAQTIDAAVLGGRAVHFMGLVSDGGVHSHQKHLYALVEMAARRGATTVWIHAFLDGRDTPPQSGRAFVAALEAELGRIGAGAVASVTGRFYAMDRDNRWDRVEKAWRAIVMGQGASATSADLAIESSYAQGVNDEFMVPTVITPAGVEAGDAVIFFNFRPDRAREITRAFTDPAFEGFERPVFPDVRFVCLTEYDPTIPAAVAFPKSFPENVLADVLSCHNLRQMHIAETEKYAHVTFFLNGGSEPPKKGEVRVLVPSPRIATYDLQPEMSAPEVTRQLVEAIDSDAADVYIVNFANCDMVGHTGIFEAAVRAVEAVDTSVGAVVSAIRAKGGTVLITADHGNAEAMVDADGSTPFTAHTLSPVPLVAVADGPSSLAHGGKLADVAPTLLDLIGIDLPKEWTGRSLLVY